MTTKMTLPSDEVPAMIAHAVAEALKAHGLSLSDELLVEIGICAMDALGALNTASPPPAAGDLLVVGHTLRGLARTAPGEGTGAALARVGEWLVEQAAEAMAAKAKAA